MYVGGEKGEANFLLQIHFPLAQPLRKNIHAILAMQVNTTRELAFPPSPSFLLGKHLSTLWSSAKERTVTWEQSLSYTVKHSYLKPGNINPDIWKVKLVELFFNLSGKEEHLVTT